MTMLAALKTYDWEEAFKYAVPEPILGCSLPLTPFEREDVVLISGMVEGENDGPSWIIYGLLKDDRWFFLDASCDYTGWDCRAGGYAKVAETRTKLIAMAMTKEHRERFGISEAKP